VAMVAAWMVMAVAAVLVRVFCHRVCVCRPRVGCTVYLLWTL